ncbi:hypothetical protein BgiBS90_031146 [Biomphalaria glabrata]|nr:hypothetical protein BgiBS90_031146 [Biomphalaria glabrata]
MNILNFAIAELAFMSTMRASNKSKIKRNLRASLVSRKHENKLMPLDEGAEDFQYQETSNEHRYPFSRRWHDLGDRNKTAGKEGGARMYYSLFPS